MLLSWNRSKTGLVSYYQQKTGKICISEENKTGFGPVSWQQQTAYIHFSLFYLTTPSVLGYSIGANQNLEICDQVCQKLRKCATSMQKYAKVC